MTRIHFSFECLGSRLVGTLDEGWSTTGLLLVTGGNELRSGAWSGQAQLAARIAGEGFSVFRFDRRGTGDSEGTNGEFRASGEDITAALKAFRARCPELTRIVGLGNCDAAAALMLAGGAGLDALVLSNPWTFDDDAGDDATPPEALRAHYRRRLADPAAIKRLLTGQVSPRKLFGSLAAALRPAPAPAPGTLTQQMAAGIDAFTGPVVFLIADRDRTAQAFLSVWPKDDARVRTCEAATHSFVEAHARDWLTQQVLDVLRA